MRLRHRDGTVVHLGYCTNVHPAESLEGVLHQLRTLSGRVRSTLDLDVLGVGLWLPAPLARQLARSPADLASLRAVLAAERLEVVSLNAFPYRGFHDPVVKKAVYRPDWSQPARLAYTLDCARVLARLLPDDAVRGSISTLPLGWRTPWHSDRAAAARRAIEQLSEGLAGIERESRAVRVAFEPEPGCVVETSDEATERLVGLDAATAGLCLDLCHLATGFESPDDVLARYGEAGLEVVKTQVSAALHVESPADPAARAALAQWQEDRFLHQTREAGRTRVAARDDLDEALGGRRALPGRHPWRVHFHVPLHAQPQPPLRSTADETRAALGLLLGGARARVDHLEVETYTWSVLPPTLRPRDDDGLVAGIAAELAWTRSALLEQGLVVDDGAGVGGVPASGAVR